MRDGWWVGGPGGGRPHQRQSGVGGRAAGQPGPSGLGRGAAANARPRAAPRPPRWVAARPSSGGEIRIRESPTSGAEQAVASGTSQDRDARVRGFAPTADRDHHRPCRLARVVEKAQRPARRPCPQVVPERQGVVAVTLRGFQHRQQVRQRACRIATPENRLRLPDVQTRHLSDGPGERGGLKGSGLCPAQYPSDAACKK